MDTQRGQHAKDQLAPQEVPPATREVFDLSEPEEWELEGDEFGPPGWRRDETLPQKPR